MKNNAVPVNLQGIHWTTYKNKTGEKILVLTKISENGTEWQKKFSVKNLLNENGEVTEQTLEEERKMFREPTRL